MFTPALPASSSLVPHSLWRAVIAYTVESDVDVDGPYWRWTLAPCAHDAITHPGRAPGDGKLSV